MTVWGVLGAVKPQKPSKYEGFQGAVQGAVGRKWGVFYEKGANS